MSSNVSKTTTTSSFSLPTTEHTHNNTMPSTTSSTMEEDDYYPKTLQEELNEITEAFYSMISEDELRIYQSYLEEMQQCKIAEGAVKAVQEAPDFELQDQDDDTVRLQDMVKKGPVVLVFYRGKWCPHCNATLMRLQRYLPEIQKRGASLVAISPMMPDGTQMLSTKRDLQFPVLSDFQNAVAKKYRLTFPILEETRPLFEKMQIDIPALNGDSSWEIPLPATYIINSAGEVVWSFIDNDPYCRGEPDDILAAIPDESNKAIVEVSPEENEKSSRDMILSKNPNKNGSSSKQIRACIGKTIKALFGKKKQPAEEYLAHYLSC